MGTAADGCGCVIVGGAAGGGEAGERELCAAVRRDVQRSRALLNLLAAQEAQMQATIQRCSGAAPLECMGPDDSPCCCSAAGLKADKRAASDAAA